MNKWFFRDVFAPWYETHLLQMLSKEGALWNADLRAVKAWRLVCARNGFFAPLRDLLLNAHLLRAPPCTEVWGARCSLPMMFFYTTQRFADFPSVVQNCAMDTWLGSDKRATYFVLARNGSIRGYDVLHYPVMEALQKLAQEYEREGYGYCPVEKTYYYSRMVHQAIHGIAPDAELARRLALLHSWVSNRPRPPYYFKDE